MFNNGERGFKETIFRYCYLSYSSLKNKYFLRTASHPYLYVFFVSSLVGYLSLLHFSKHYLFSGLVERKKNSRCVLRVTLEDMFDTLPPLIGMFFLCFHDILSGYRLYIFSRLQHFYRWMYYKNFFVWLFSSSGLDFEIGCSMSPYKKLCKKLGG